MIKSTVTYHHRWMVPLLVSTCSIWVDAIIDDLECCQANSLHGAEVGLPEPACLQTNGAQLLKTYPYKLETDERKKHT